MHITTIQNQIEIHRKRDNDTWNKFHGKKLDSSLHVFPASSFSETLKNSSLNIVTSCKPFWDVKVPDLSGLHPCIYVSTCGWHEDRWHDGWFIHTATGNPKFIATAIPPCGLGSITVDLSQSPFPLHTLSALDALGSPDCLRHRSLVAGIRERIPKGECSIQLSGFEMKDAALLVLIKQALPKKTWSVTHEQKFKSWEPRWKRLLEGIGTHYEDQPRNAWPLEDLRRAVDLIPSDVFDGIVGEVNRPTRILAQFKR